MNRLNRILALHSPPAELMYAESCESTNYLARQRILEPGSPNIVLALAEHQTNGQGLGKHVWESPGGRDVLFTLAIRQAALGYNVDGRLPLCIGVLIQNTIRSAFGIILHCKWPNDLLAYDGRKVGGILVRNHANHLAVGVGLNINSLPKDYPEELRGRIITLREIVGHELDRMLVLLTVVPELLKHFVNTPEYSCEELISQWERCAIGLGESYTLHIHGKPERVTTLGIKQDTGELVARCEDGTEITLSSAQYMDF